VADLTIHSWQRVAFAGKTGSGKTYAARYLLQPIRRLICIDPKMQLVGDRSWRLEAPSRQAYKALSDGEYARIVIWQPPALDSDGFPVWDSVFEYAWSIGDVVVYIDEMYSVAKNGRLSWPLRRLYTQGRFPGIGVWASTQRPSFVPLEMFSESEWSFTFTLRVKKDRVTVADNLGFDQVQQPIRDVHGFWAAYQTWPEPMYFSQLDTRAEKAMDARVEATTPVTDTIDAPAKGQVAKDLAIRRKAA